MELAVAHPAMQKLERKHGSSMLRKDKAREI